MYTHLIRLIVPGYRMAEKDTVSVTGASGEESGQSTSATEEAPKEEQELDGETFDSFYKEV